MATNTACWKFSSTAQVEPPQEITPDQAQAWCNFVLVMPGWLPSDCRQPFTGSLRMEAPPARAAQDANRPNWTRANTSSYLTIAQSPERRLRIKQFLYDWAPPASDHPALWGSKDRPVTIDSKRIGWLGTDYEKRAAASAILWGTTCEVRVEQGFFTETELTRICRELHPVDSKAKDLIAVTPFSKLSYWARYPCALVPVPHGLWKVRRTKLDIPHAWFSKADAKRSLIATLPQCPEGWNIDSIGVFGAMESPEEIEILYVHGTRDRYLWCTVLFNKNHIQLDVPPEKDTHPCQTRVIDVNGVEVHHAWIDDHYGPHDGVWQKDGRTYMLQGNAAVGFDPTAFANLLSVFSV
ncbi:MAG TPA: hypothetical protein V6C81_15250 [Planktothrix sp.]|jgi:hypothetical protein